MYFQTMIVFDILVLYRYYDTTSAVHVDSKKIVERFLKRDRHAMYTSVHFQTSKNSYRLKLWIRRVMKTRIHYGQKMWTIVSVQARKLSWLIKSCFVFFVTLLAYVPPYHWTNHKTLSQTAGKGSLFVRFNNYEITERQKTCTAPLTLMKNNNNNNFLGSRQISWDIFISRSVCDISISKPWEIKREFVHGIKRERKKLRE